MGCMAFPLCQYDAVGVVGWSEVDLASGSIPDRVFPLLFSWSATILWPFLTTIFSMRDLVHPIFRISSVERERCFISKARAEGDCN